MKTIFGPVYSRRFGASLGVDLSPDHKQCNFDCLYCELSPAKAVKTQHDVIPLNSVIADLQKALNEHPAIDVITITANGEPTMYPHLRELVEQIDAIKGNAQTLILSNSACLNDPVVFDTLLRLDQVKLSLDAATQEVFKKIDRPAEGIEVRSIIDSIHRFSRVFRGKLFIEILFVKGVNDTPAQIAALNRALREVTCERIDIGTIDRPPAYPVEGLSFTELHAIAGLFDPALPIHIVSRTHAHATPSPYSDDEILNTLDKRPLTRDDIEALFDTGTLRRFETLCSEGKIARTERSNVVFYIPAKNIARKRSK
ncbi:MAG: radical SAM protein [Campylobacterota bacterium]